MNTTFGCSAAPERGTSASCASQASARRTGRDMERFMRDLFVGQAGGLSYKREPLSSLLARAGKCELRVRGSGLSGRGDHDPRARLRVRAGVVVDQADAEPPAHRGEVRGLHRPLAPRELNRADE